MKVILAACCNVADKLKKVLDKSVTKIIDISAMENKVA